MECESACRLINDLIIYEPNWKITATDHTNRFEGTIVIRIDYPARNTNRDQADGGYANPIMTYASFTIVAHECSDMTELYRQVLQRILLIHEHEAREYFRIHPTNWAPFHPHRLDGMKAWGNPASDLQFGAT